MVRPEQRLVVENATADWFDYLQSSGEALVKEESFESGNACMAEGRRLFSGRDGLPGSEASEGFNGQSIQCVKGCRVDTSAAVMLCEEVTQPEIFR